MAIAVFVMTFGVIGWDVISTVRAKAEAGRQLQEQKRKAAELEAVMKEQRELEAKIKNIDLRIDAIKKLRSSQAGPSAVLESLRERIKMTPDIHLLSVDQQGDQLTIKGSSKNELAITQFGRSLEFSGGLFSNLGIETQRKEITGQTVSVKDAEPPKIEVVDFTIKCAYTPEKGSSSGAALAADSGGAPADNRNQTASGPKS
jgi:Tfp pilus assembly protein PilN